MTGYVLTRSMKGKVRWIEYPTIENAIISSKKMQEEAENIPGTQYDNNYDPLVEIAVVSSVSLVDHRKMRFINA